MRLFFGGVIILLPGLLVFASLAYGNASLSSTSHPDTRRQAELVYLLRHDCGSCHGMTLKGGLGKPLLPKSLENLDESAISQIILDGVPDTPMPPWRGLLQPNETLWLAHKLKQGLE